MLAGYCFPHSVQPGDAVPLHASSSFGPVHVTVTRAGARREVVARFEDVMVGDHAVPPGAVHDGCGWPAATEIVTAASWPSGFYEVALEPARGWPRGSAPRDGSNLAFFVLHPPAGASRRILLVLGTNTWLAYNDFAGSNLYTGSTHVSWERPLAPGLLAKPPGAGRRVAVLHPPDERMATHVGYLALERLSPWAGSAGWPNYEEPFVTWAERAGYAFDVATNADLEREPGLLDGVALVCCVGHDEYWSSPQRDALEAHVARGGNLAVLSGNTCYWQVRYEDGGRTMVCYKQRYADDPVYTSGDRALLTSIWSDREIGRPETTLLGVSFVHGGYARIGRRVPRGSGGYTVYRPEHWMLAGTALEYGDLLGAASTVVGYECDGCTFTFVDGRPVPTGDDGCPDGFEIVATSPAAPFDRRTSVRPVPEGELSEIEFNAARALGDSSAATCERLAYGNAVMGAWRHASGGTVVDVGCTDWVCGLGVGDDAVERVTRNVLDRLG